MHVVGLTGGICSGKSVASNILGNLGITIIDADVISKNLTQAGTSYTQKITDHFGPIVTDGKIGLNRQALAHLIFSDPLERQWLEALLHPPIRAAMAEAILHAKGNYRGVLRIGAGARGSL